VADVAAGVSTRGVVGVVLAAGASRRMGAPKATMRDGAGRTWVEAITTALLDGGCACVVVVVGPPHEDAVRAALATADRVAITRNEHPERGMLSSAALGLRAALADPDVDAVVLALVDHPAVRAGTIAAVAEARGAASAAWARPVLEGRAGHPIAIARAVAEQIATSGATTLRDALRAAGRPLDVPVGDPGVLEDRDEP
jgi:CTP:molybdopterin cytidylyltransferase MocA